MIYECDQCSKALPPGIHACPSCEETFEAVPADAQVLKRGFTAKSDAMLTDGLSATLNAPDEPMANTSKSSRLTSLDHLR